MPVLSAADLDPGSSGAVCDVAVLNGGMLDAHAGEIGEHPGVGLFATLLPGFFALAFFRSSRAPTLFALRAAVAALLFCPREELIGADGGAIRFVNVFTCSFRAIVFGPYLIVASRRRGAALPQA